MKVFKLIWLDPSNKDAAEWEITEQWNFNSITEAKAFCKGLNLGFDKGRLDHYYAVTEDETHSYKIKNAFVFDLKPRLDLLNIGFLMEYVNEEKTAFHIPDYKLSQAVGELEKLLSKRG